jgi:hypothetical protein
MLQADLASRGGHAPRARPTFLPPGVEIARGHGAALPAGAPGGVPAREAT